jgi:prenyltransferase beta subunit/ankyrin repeat protein
LVTLEERMPMNFYTKYLTELGVIEQEEALEIYKRTVSFLRGLKNDDGGYSDQISNSNSSLLSTLSAIKALRLLDAAPDDPYATLDYVNRCFDEASSGFSDRPGGEPTALSTAVALIALCDIGAWKTFKKRTEPSMRFMTETSRSPLDHFITIAAYDEGKIPAPAPASAVAFFRNQRQEDGTFGLSASVNAMACGALLRAGETLKDTELLVERLLGAQRTDGGFSDDDSSSDLMTTYFIMRTLNLLNTSPDIDKLKDFITPMQVEGGGYRMNHGVTAAVGPTYQAISILRYMAKFQGFLAEKHGDTKVAVEAARTGDINALKSWLADGGDPDQYESDEGWTPLLAAAARGQAEVAELLLFHDIQGAKRANPDLRFVEADALPIFMAGQAGDLGTVKVLLKARPQHLFEISKVNGHTLLLQAAFYGLKEHLELAEYLLGKVGEILSIPEGNYDARKNALKRLTAAAYVRGANSLDIARFWNNKPMIALLDKYDPPTEIERKAYMDELLEKIAPPEPRDEEDRRVQSLTDSLVDTILNELKRAGELPTNTNKEIDEAVSEILKGINRLLETPGFEINRLGGTLQQTPIIWVLTGKDVNENVSMLRKALVVYLLNRGADPDIPEKHPMAVDAIIRASVLNHFEVLKTIADHMTPESFAAALNEKPAVNGQTALYDTVHQALKATPATLPVYLEQIRWSIDHGARIDIAEHTGKTLADMVRGELDNPGSQDNALAVLEELGLKR